MENERIAKDIKELIEIWKGDITIKEISEPSSAYYGFDDNEDGFKNIIIDFDLSIPFEEDSINAMERHLNRNVDPYKFKDCIFKQKVEIHNRSDHYVFSQNCSFEKELKIRVQKSNLSLLNCSIKHLNFKDAVFGGDSDNANKGKVRLRSCELFDVNFRNTTFNNLADFWDSTFHKKTIFYKTDFLATTVFSIVKFKENVLFTYSLLNGKTIFRGTKVFKGIDLSLAIIVGDLAVYDFKVPDFFVLLQEQTDKVYEKNVSKNGDIPIKNKRETLRILKQIHESQSNVVESLPFRKMEKETLAKELATNSGFSNFIDKIILKLNKSSNNYGTSIIHSLLFIVSVGWFFFYCSLIATDSFEFSGNPSEWEFTKGLGYFVQFLLPTHRFNYMGTGISLTAGFYLFDFLGRIFVGYGIYQFIQAFRKFK